MLNRRSTFIQNLYNRKGQVALFIALIFQILFLFFAMVINVGLLVHHKINLQNSVDLAAYYGAMKQAENMNAIAHINYQIRQSWKLLAWRYRMLGSAGEWEFHPYNKTSRQINPAKTGDIIDSSNILGKNFQEAPAFCITYIPFKPMPPGENTCKYMATMSPIRMWVSPPHIAGHQAFSGSIRNASEVLRANALARCRYFGSYNYVMLGKFIVAFNVDQGDRMAAISALSRATSFKEDDFYDLDGQSVKAGIEKTLLNNLTSANRATANMSVFNSLGADGCNAMGAAEGQPAKWLTPIRIYPGFRYVDTDCSKDISTTPKELTGNPQSFPIHKDSVPDLSANIDTLAQFIGYRSNLNDNYNFSVGVEKNPWCMAYTGVSATAEPKIPFSPFGTVKLKARAFYKPFGGRMGPWYYKMWRRGSAMSEGSANDKTDPLLPPRVTDVSALGNIGSDPANDSIRASNYSRFVGDPFGLKTYKMLAYYGQAIYNLDPGWRSGSVTPDNGNGQSVYDGGDAPNFDHWEDIPFNFVKSQGSGDILAWDSKTNRPSAMRILETAAILPDQFDITYYSIEPDFYHLYYKRIRDGYFQGPGKGFNKSFRPDIGYHRGYKQGSYNFEEFSIKNQYETVKDPGDVVNTNGLIKDQFTFTTMDWKHMLTSWAPKTLNDYSLDTNKLGKCQIPATGSDKNNPQPATSGNCVVGGTTGYSVKMVSSDYLRSSELTLGGEAGGSGPLLNPPPADDEF
ncbi:Tad domain-containing protein [Bdellovibrio sp. 22V]|uniref:Tad domain-containing protein n=1 Tax=Bdellovibrio TaxID=958 RepID=UPI002542C87C|nr:Tad domain-containing protein [Bdellovibrio sp. 22V]WII72699.1 Tad domain-containing protein [Bdellovibrio sp. 22V]